MAQSLKNKLASFSKDRQEAILKRAEELINEELTWVGCETIEDFFARGKNVAKLLDEKNSIPKRRIISFEDPRDLEKFFTDTN